MGERGLEARNRAGGRGGIGDDRRGGDKIQKRPVQFPRLGGREKEMDFYVFDTTKQDGLRSAALEEAAKKYGRVGRPGKDERVMGAGACQSENF